MEEKSRAHVKMSSEGAAFFEAKGHSLTNNQVLTSLSLSLSLSLCFTLPPSLSFILFLSPTQS